MAKFAQFTDEESGEPVHVNTTLVRAAFPGTADATVLCFDEQHTIVLKDNIEAVMRVLNDA